MRSVLVVVSDLDRSIAFYQDVVDLRQRLREDQLAVLGDEKLPPFYLYLREENRRPTRYGQNALGVRTVAFDVPSGAELDRIEGRLRSFDLFVDRQRLDVEDGLEFVRGHDPDRLPLVFVATEPDKEYSVATLQRVAALLYGVDV